MASRSRSSHLNRPRIACAPITAWKQGNKLRECPPPGAMTKNMLPARHSSWNMTTARSIRVVKLSVGRTGRSPRSCNIFLILKLPQTTLELLPRPWLDLCAMAPLQSRVGLGPDRRQRRARRKPGRSAGRQWFGHGRDVSLRTEGTRDQVPAADRKLSRHARLRVAARHAVAFGCARRHRVSSRFDAGFQDRVQIAPRQARERLAP